MRATNAQLRRLRERGWYYSHREGWLRDCNPFDGKDHYVLFGYSAHEALAVDELCLTAWNAARLKTWPPGMNPEDRKEED